MPRMNRHELAVAVRDRVEGLTLLQASRAIDALFGEGGGFEEALVDGARIVVAGFGTWRVVVRAARRGAHPITGAPMEIPSKRVVHFKQGAALGARLGG